MVSSGWATGDEIDVFRHTVNCPAALGRGARHAARKCSESEHMSLKEAYSLVGKVLRAGARAHEWLDCHPEAAQMVHLGAHGSGETGA